MKVIRSLTYQRQDVFHAENTDELWVNLDASDAIIKQALTKPNPQHHINLNGYCPKYQPTLQQASRRKREELEICQDALVSEVHNGMISKRRTVNNILNASNTPYA